jgi:putative ABC transport system ATP-binding protein
MTTPLLSGRSLALRFGRTAALSGVDLDLAASEVVAVMGASGSGKSTLLHCLAGILRPDSGEVHFAGERIDALSERERSALRRKDFGFVFQFGELVPELTLLENVALPLRLAGLSRRTAEGRALEMLARLEVGDVAAKRSTEVSGGQAQRAAVARALVHRPRVVFADEPTGALDTVSGELVLDALTSLARELGSAVLMVTHEARVASYADREVVMRNGSIVAPATLS